MKIYFFLFSFIFLFSTSELSAVEKKKSVINDKLGKDVGLLQEWWLNEAQSMKWLIPTGLIIIAVAIIGFVVIHRIKKRLKPDSSSAILLSSISRPIFAIIALVGVFAFIVPVLKSIPELESCDFKLFLGLVTLCVTWGALEIVSIFSRGVSVYAKKGTANLDFLIVDIMRKILKIIIVTIAIFFIGKSVFNLNVVPLITGAGVAGLAIAFASKETLSNFFGTLVIIGDKPFRCGDTVRIGDVSGIVENIGMRSTRILTPDESIVLIPNSSIESSNIENISNRGVMRFNFSVGLTYDATDADIEKAIKLLHSLLDDFHGKDTERYKPRIFFDSLGNSALNIKCIMWLKTSSFHQEELWRTEINSAIIKGFADANLEMPYNTVTNYLYGDPDHPIRVDLANDSAVR